MGCNPINKFQIIVKPVIKKLTEINGIGKKAKEINRNRQDGQVIYFLSCISKIKIL